MLSVIRWPSGSNLIYAFLNLSIVVVSIIFFTAEAQSSQRVVIFLFAVDPPNKPADRKAANKKAQALRANPEACP